MTEQQLLVSEVFGPTFQGEGPHAGRHCAFVRLGRCNLDCSWCDTPYTWDWRGKNGVVFDPKVELSKMDALDVCCSLEAMGAHRVVVTGGEPLVQMAGLESLVLRCESRGWAVEIETNGTIAPSPVLLCYVDLWNVSPKLSNSGIPVERRIKLDVLKQYAELPNVAFKFVCRAVSDLDEIIELERALGPLDIRDRLPVWIMPEGRQAVELCARGEELAPRVLAEGWNMTLRQQVLLWGDTRGT